MAMETRRANNHRIFTLEVHLKCCKQCPVKIKKKLLKLSGVKDVAIDTEKGLVNVTGIGNLNPSTLVKTVVKAGKKVVKLCSPDAINQTNNPYTDGRQNKSQISDSRYEIKDREKKAEMNVKVEEDGRKNGGDRRRADPIASEYLPHHREGNGRIHTNEAAPFNPMAAPPYNNRPCMMPPPLQFRAAGPYGNQGFWPRMSEPLPPQMPPPLQPVYGYFRSEPPPPMHPGYSYYPPEPPPVLRPLLPPHFFEYQQPPAGNAPAHYVFSDENTNGCAIV